ncbi:MAG TPA: hypothetical protein VGF84_00835 [Micromonosporaceae bacterium]
MSELHLVARERAKRRTVVPAMRLEYRPLRTDRRRQEMRWKWADKLSSNPRTT